MVTTLNTALRFELVGQEALVHDPAGGFVVRLTGVEHSVIVRLTNGEQIVDPTESEQAAIDRLVEAGIVLKDDSSSSRFSRRRVMQLSAAGVAAAGLTYLVLPSAAAAASTPTTTTARFLPPSPPASSSNGDPDPSDAGASFFGRSVSVIWQATSPTSFNYAGAFGRRTRCCGTLAAVTVPDTTFLPVSTQSLWLRTLCR